MYQSKESNLILVSEEKFRELFISQMFRKFNGMVWNLINVFQLEYLQYHCEGGYRHMV